MIKPQILRKGDTIGVVTLANAVSETESSVGAQILSDMGYKVIFGEHFLSQDFPASSPLDRATDLMNMFRDTDVSMILASRGGTGSADVLPYLDYQVIQSNPKIFSGYSDITSLLNYITQHTGLITFSGLMLRSFSPAAPPYNYEQFFSTIAEPMLGPRQLLNPPHMSLVSKFPGNITGSVVGGNLTLIVNSLGTPFEIDTRGKILLIEDVTEPVRNLYRMLTHLKLAGKLDSCLGFIIGELTECTNDNNPSMKNITPQEIVDRVLLPLNKPMIANVAASHGEYTTTIPIGTAVNMNTLDNSSPTLSLMEAPVEF